MLKTIHIFYTLFLISVCSNASAQSVFPIINVVEARKISSSLPKIKNPLNRVKSLLELSIYHIAKPAEKKKDLDSASAFLIQAEQLSRTNNYLSGQLSSMIYRGILSHELGDDQLALSTLRKVIDLTKSKGLPAIESRAWYELAFLVPDKEKLLYYKASAKCLIKAGLPVNAAKLSWFTSNIYTKMGNRPEALNELLSAAKLYKSANYIKLHEHYEQIAQQYEAMGNIPEALKYTFLAIESAARDKRPARLPFYYHHIGLMYKAMKEYPMARRYFMKASEYIEPKNSISSFGLAAEIQNTFISENRTKEGLAYMKEMIRKYPTEENEAKLEICKGLLQAHLKLRQMDLAKKYGEEMLNYEAKRGSPDQYSTYTYVRAAELYYALKDYDKVEDLLKKTAALNDGSLVGINRFLAYQMFRLDSVRGNFIGAIKHYQHLKLYEDSIYDHTRSQQIASLQIQYEVRQKENDLMLQQESIRSLNQQSLILRQNSKLQQAQLDRAFLSTKNALSDLELRKKDISFLNQSAKLQQASLQKQVFKQKVIIGAGLSSLLVSILLYYLYRTKQRSNTLLRSQQREIEEQNIQLKNLLNEKQWLVKEIHHRVKNNLHTVMSLLESQSAYLENDALEAIKNSRHRIFAMSLIHQKLYLSEEIKTINMAIYIPELISYLRDSFGMDQRIEINMDIEPVEFGVAEAVPLGLIINEVINNSLKYAFKNREEGLIRISLKSSEDHSFQLIIQDDGIGLPADFDIDRSTSLGMKLIKGLSAQIDAMLQIESNMGTKIMLSQLSLYHLYTLQSIENRTLDANL